jgi:hypothetical protein
MGGMLTRLSTGLLPVYHGPRDLTILDRGTFVHLYLSPPTPEEVFDCGDIAGGHRGCLSVKCVANEEGELGLGLRWFRSHHPKCTGICELEKRRDKDSTHRLYRARTSLCSPDFLDICEW